MIRKCLEVVLGVVLIASVAEAHGGTWRGPRWPTPPPPRSPFDPTPPPDRGIGTPGMPGGPITPPGPPGGPGTQPPGNPLGGLPGGRPSGIPAPAGRRPWRPPASQTTGLTQWVYWWNLNRERILNLRALQTERLRARVSGSNPRFFGGEDEGNIRPGMADAAREKIFKALLKAAEHRNADLSTGAIIALGKAGDPRAIPPLMKIVSSRKADQTAVESAALALGMIGKSSPELRSFLADVIKDPRHTVRTSAFAALGLGFLGDVGAVPALVGRSRAKAASREIPACSLLGLGLLGDEIVVPDLVQTLAGREKGRRSDDILRAYAAASLGMIRSRAAIPALQKALRDKDLRIRRQAVLSLGAIGRPDDQGLLKDLFHLLANDRDGMVRAFAAVSLGEIGAPLAGNALLYAYRKGDAVVVPYAALGLALLGRDNEAFRERVIPLIRAQLIEQGSHDLRGALVISLGILRDEASVPVLVKLLRSRGDPTLRGHAAMALGLIGADEAIPILRKALEERANPDLQREVALALGILGDREGEQILARLVREGSTDFVRGSAAVSLGRLASPETAASLRETLEDDKVPNSTRAFVAVALGLVMDRNEYPLLSRLGEHFNHLMAVEAVMEVLTFL